MLEYTCHYRLLGAKVQLPDFTELFQNFSAFMWFLHKIWLQKVIKTPIPQKVQVFFCKVLANCAEICNNEIDITLSHYNEL